MPQLLRKPAREASQEAGKGYQEPLGLFVSEGYATCCLLGVCCLVYVCNQSTHMLLLRYNFFSPPFILSWSNYESIFGM